MKDKMNVPETIMVGYVDRGDTYTGKLAYVIYKDHKGVLRKEKSWQSWRDHEIDPQEFNNEPTEGFVLNKKAGGGRYGWNPRQTYCRIYDPRGFEFEITIPNLLFILQECSSLKGKGLEGEFVYAWSGTEVVLLPVSSPEYKTCKEFTAAKSMKVGRKDMLPGCIYRTKDMVDVMYIGRYKYYDNIGIVNFYSTGTAKTGKKRHVFVKVNWDGKDEWGPGKYWIQDGFTKLAQRLSDDPTSDFANELEDFLNGEHYAEIVDMVVEPDTTPIKKKESRVHDTDWVAEVYVSTHNENIIHRLSLQSPSFTGGFNRRIGINGSIGVGSSDKIEIRKPGLLPMLDGYSYSYGSNWRTRADQQVVDIDEINSRRVNIFAVLENGKRINLTKQEEV